MTRMVTVEIQALAELAQRPGLRPTPPRSDHPPLLHVLDPSAH